MAKILSIGISGYSNDEIEIILDVTHVPSLFDYDIVIVDLNAICETRYNYDDWEYIQLTSTQARKFIELSNRLQKDAAILLEKGGVIICLVTPIIGLKYEVTGGYDVKTNYEWIPIRTKNGSIKSTLKRGTGTGIKDLKKSPFEQYLNAEPKWVGYFDELDSLLPVKYIFKELNAERENKLDFEILAKNEGNKPIAFSVNVGKGKLVFLPLSLHEKFPDILIQCATKSISKHKGLPPPKWITRCQTPGEKELQNSMEKTIKKLQEVEKEKQDIEKKLNENTIIKKLLYEQDEELESAVKIAFEELGITMKKKGSKDWIAKADGKEAVVEVTGQKASIDVTKLSQLVRYRVEEEGESKDKKVAILAGNHFIDTEPEKRGEPFTEEAVNRANALSIVLLPTTELYYALCKLRENKITAEEIRKKLFSTIGICKLV